MHHLQPIQSTSTLPAMKSSHGVLLLAVALAVLSSGMCSTVMVTTAEAFPPEYTCSTAIGSGACDLKTCRDDCLRQLKGEGQCVAAGCKCWYYCNPPPAPAPAPAPAPTDI